MKKPNMGTVVVNKSKVDLLPHNLKKSFIFINYKHKSFNILTSNIY